MPNPKNKQRSTNGLRNTFLLLLLIMGLFHELPAHSTDPEQQMEQAESDFTRARELRFTQAEAADELFQRAQEAYLNLELWNKATACTIYRSQLNYELGRLDSLQHILDKAQGLLDNKDLKGENYRQERIYYFRAMLFEARAQYEEAQEMLTRASAILEALENPIGLDSSYMSSHKALSGSIYYGRGDFETAIHRYQTALNLFPASRPNEAKLLNLYNNLGLALFEMDRVPEGMGYLETSRQILPELDPAIYFNDYLQTYFNLIKGHLLLENTTQALGYLAMAQPLLEHKKDDEHIWYSLQAQVKDQQENYPSALYNYRLALAKRITVRGRQHPSIARLHQSIGQIYLKMGKDEAALEAFQRGLMVFDPKLRPEQLFAVPSLEHVDEYYPLIQLLKAKGDLLVQHDPFRASEILPTFRVAIQAIDSLRLLYESDASKLLLSKEAKDVFGAAIALLHRLHQLAPDSGYLEEAFQYMEKTKALLLLENIRKWRNIRLSDAGQNQTDSEFNRLLEQEKNAKLDLVLLQRLLKDALEQTTDGSRQSEKIGTLEQALRKRTAAYEAIKEDLAQRFTSYYEASYGEDVTDITTVRDKLLTGDDTALISYFIHGERSFALLISRDSVSLEQLAGPAIWEQAFLQYQAALRAQENSVLSDTIFQQYTRSASELYQQLLAPLVQQLPEDCRRLYLIPDDRLGFLAFESLLTRPAAAAPVNYSVEHLDYLLEQFAPAYGYSATLLVESIKPQTKKDQRKNYGGFAPVFEDHAYSGQAVSRDCSTGELMYLPYSKESVEATTQLYKGEAFLHEAASLKNFMAAAQDYRILQLSTHACVDNDNALFNVLYFHDTTLANYQIFDIPIRADLVILSACETGTGDLLEGEGIMSLSRGFYYAGCSNVITSLWPADDHATKELMILLNRNLKKGLHKDEALRRAKLDFLESGTLRKTHLAPSTWANFILIGNQEQIQLSTMSPIMLLILGSGALLLFGLLIYFYQR